MRVRPPAEVRSRGNVAAATWKKLSSHVDVDLRKNVFRVEQRWRVHGATRGELMAAVPHLTLSGRYGVYGDGKLLITDTPQAEQNSGRGARAWAHPVFAPSALGAMASTEPTQLGFKATMTGGKLGRGSSEVHITQGEGGAVDIVERGTYTLAELHSRSTLMDTTWAMGAATVGRAPLALAHRAMGELHNTVFNAAEPLVNWTNDHPRHG